MSVSAEALRELHGILRQLSDAQGRLDRGPKKVKASESNVKRLDEEHAKAKEVLKRLQLTSSEQELQLKEREGRILDLRGKMNSCSSNKEYQALVEQIAADEQASNVLSDEILEFFETVNAQQEVVNAAEANVQTAKQELESLKGKVSAEHATLVSEVTRLTAELSKAESNLPSEIKANYERMARASGEDAMAPVEGEVCGGCYQTLTPNMLNELALSRIVFCKSCGRLLYMPEDTAPESAAE